MLPNLPKTIKKREAQFGLRFRQWLKAVGPLDENAVFELKQTLTDSISFNCVEEKQINYLVAISGPVGALIRIIGTNGEPDYALLKNTPAYVVIKYPKHAFGIDVRSFLKEKETSLRRSLTAQRAAQIASWVIPH